MRELPSPHHIVGLVMTVTRPSLERHKFTNTIQRKMKPFIYLLLFIFIFIYYYIRQVPYPTTAGSARINAKKRGKKENRGRSRPRGEQCEYL